MILGDLCGSKLERYTLAFLVANSQAPDCEPRAEEGRLEGYLTGHYGIRDNNDDALD